MKDFYIYFPYFVTFIDSWQHKNRDITSNLLSSWWMFVANVACFKKFCEKKLWKKMRNNFYVLLNRRSFKSEIYTLYRYILHLILIGIPTLSTNLNQKMFKLISPLFGESYPSDIWLPLVLVPRYFL